MVVNTVGNKVIKDNLKQKKITIIELRELEKCMKEKINNRVG